MSSNDSSLESLSGLAAFARAAEAEGFAAAGRRLGISASAVGKSIARLEKTLVSGYLTERPARFL